jgi:hypothetical protein
MTTGESQTGMDRKGVGGIHRTIDLRSFKEKRLLFQGLGMPSTQPSIKVSLRSFKEFVAKNFDETTPFYKVLMREKDEVSREEFAAKFDVWLGLVNLSVPAEP